MKIKLQNLKDPITDIIGLVIILLTIYEKHIGNITWIWEGVAGMLLGGGMFIMPDEWLKDTLTAIRDKVLNQKPEQ